jgi:L-alanine-DL-glutamate epimerase-like enolase superfamily enzyme
VREVCPEATIIVDANQSWDSATFTVMEPHLLSLGVTLLEQPFKVGDDAILQTYQGRLAIAADESVITSADVEGLRGKYDVLNIKLDKTGGLSEAIKLAQHARELGFDLMVGNMCGSSLAMAPALVIAQLCKYVDLDGPLLQKQDWTPCLQYKAGGITCPSQSGLWAGL